MTLIDAHDQQERAFAASLHGLDLSGSDTNTLKPGRTSSQTTVGLDAFYRKNWNDGLNLAGVEL
jgi:hypothetical protein